MLTRLLPRPLLGVLLAFGLGAGAGAVDAATITMTKNYGSAPGYDQPTAGSGNRVTVAGDHAILRDGSSGEPFFQSFDLSGILGTITGISFTITHSGATDQSKDIKIFGIPVGKAYEAWTVYVADRLHNGTPDVRSSNTAQAFAETLGSSGTNTYALSGNALATALTGSLATIWFGENTASDGQFRLFSIAMTVTTVPVPAAGLLLLGGLGGLALLRRRRPLAA